MMRSFHAYTLDTILMFGDIGSKIRFWNVVLNGNRSIEAKVGKSPLQVKAVTTNGPANVNAHPSFQGKIQLSTKDSEPELYENSGVVVYSSGEGRARQAEYISVRLIGGG
ncbi:hypothetical protein BDN70DRAFT_888900 [Pholiota conissans]|uniref:Uncharacterized protein n=1 Tax=Pholiota conissans TaxID=109636 RepID=A0A9P6CL27_9AGAR|nr:hypothetical protein BDN70DRAFT_888900 [Pholiota conissans]